MTTSLHPDLLNTIEFVFDKCGFKYSAPAAEPESAEYGAAAFKIDGLSARFRAAKITPTKTGQFVSIWKRIPGGTTAPYKSSDKLDLYIINTRKGKRNGQFIFPKAALIKHGIMAHKDKPGKRAMRVYPPWDEANSKQAAKTKAWQSEYFLELPDKKPVDQARVKALYFP